MKVRLALGKQELKITFPDKVTVTVVETKYTAGHKDQAGVSTRCFTKSNQMAITNHLKEEGKE